MSLFSFPPRTLMIRAGRPPTGPLSGRKRLVGEGRSFSTERRTAHPWACPHRREALMGRESPASLLSHHLTLHPPRIKEMRMKVCGERKRRTPLLLSLSLFWKEEKGRGCPPPCSGWCGGQEKSLLRPPGRLFSSVGSGLRLAASFLSAVGSLNRGRSQQTHEPEQSS